MLIQALDFPDFRIDDAGIITKTAKWLLSAESDDGDFAVAAALWTGSTGQNWRVPNASGTGYTADNTVRISKIECHMLDCSSCEITFYGVPRIAAAVQCMGRTTRERRANLEEFRTAVFQVPSALLDSFMPQIGSALTWAGSNSLCESVQAEEQNDGSYLVTVRAVDTSVRAAGEITSLGNAQHENVKTGTWLVQSTALSTFLAANALHCPASWAGANYYVSEVATEPADSALRTKVVLKARKADYEMIEAVKQEEIVSCSGIVPVCDNVWISRWRTSGTNRSQFDNLLGTSAAAWAETGYIVSKVTPKRISDCEYEYTLEARDPETVTSHYSHRFWSDRDLATRHEFRVRVGEFRLTGRHCGYCWSYRGRYVPLLNWNPALDCPFVSNTTLPIRWIHQSMRLLEVAEITYHSGRSANNVDIITAWFTGGRVVAQTLSGVTGSWLKYDCDVDDITDSQDRRWTRVTKIYRLAPPNYAWNPNYWI